MEKIPAGDCQLGQEYFSPRGDRLTYTGQTDGELALFRSSNGATVSFPLTALLAPAPEDAEGSPLDHIKTTTEMLKGADRGLVESRIHELDVEQLTDLGTRDGRMWVQALIATELERRGFEQVQARATEAGGDPKRTPHAFDGKMQTCDICHQGRAHPLHARQATLISNPPPDGGARPAGQVKTGVHEDDHKAPAPEGGGPAPVQHGAVPTDESATSPVQMSCYLHGDHDGDECPHPDHNATTAATDTKDVTSPPPEDPPEANEDLRDVTSENPPAADSNPSGSSEARAQPGADNDCDDASKTIVGDEAMKRAETNDILTALVDAPAAGARVDIVKNCSDLAILKQLDVPHQAVAPPLQATVMREVGRQIKALQKVHDGSQKDRRGWLDSKHIQSRPGALALCRKLLGDEAPAEPAESKPASTTTATSPDTDGDPTATATEEVGQNLIRGLDKMFGFEPPNDGESEPVTKPDENKQPTTEGYISPAERKLIEKLLPGREVSVTRSKVGAPGALAEDGWMARIEDRPVAPIVGYGLKPTDAIEALAKALKPKDVQEDTAEPEEPRVITKSYADANCFGEEAVTAAQAAEASEEPAVEPGRRDPSMRIDVSKLHPTDLLACVVRWLPWYRDHGIDIQIGTRRGDS